MCLQLGVINATHNLICCFKTSNAMMAGEIIPMKCEFERENIPLYRRGPGPSYSGGV